MKFADQRLISLAPEMAELLERWESLRTWMLDDGISHIDEKEQQRRLHEVTVETRELLRRAQQS